MKSQTKIQLSPYEMELVNNADVILTKNGIIQKVKQLLENLQGLQHQYIISHSKKIPAEVIVPTAKISKGENYKGLPYLILDQPRYFDKENIFAVRTMFWWGNFFSITLHLSGRYKKKIEKKIITSQSLLAKNDFYICAHENEWEHHFEIDNYVPVSNLDKIVFEKQIMKKPFIKLAQKIPLNHWKNMEEMLISKYEQIFLLTT